MLSGTLLSFLSNARQVEKDIMPHKLAPSVNTFDYPRKEDDNSISELIQLRISVSREYHV